MNKEPLLRVREEILAHPELLDMREWCGTPCCIAGHLAKESNHPGYTFALATEILGLDEGEAYNLFISSFWPKPLLTRHINAENPAERAQVAAEAIDWFISEYE